MVCINGELYNIELALLNCIYMFIVQFSSMLNLIKPIECNFKGMKVFESPSIKLPEIWVSLKGISHLEMKYSRNIESFAIQNKTNIRTSNFLGSLFSIFCWLDDAVVEPRLRGL